MKGGETYENNLQKIYYSKKDEIMAIKDRAERREAIRQNIELFE